MQEFTVVALVRPQEIRWDDDSSIRAALCVDWVAASSADHARTAFLVAFAKRSGIGLDDIAVLAAFPGHLTEGDPPPSGGKIAQPEAAKRDAEAVLDDGPTVVSIRQFMRRHACFTMGWLRQMLFHRETNGLADAVVQCGRKILIDEAKFFAWLEAQQGRGAARDLRGGKHERNDTHQPFRRTR